MAADEPTDEELVRHARRGHDASLHRLLLRHRRRVRAQARSFFLAGAELEDLVQEGMIGLFKAVQDFDPRHGATFRTFADVCVARQLVTAVRSASRRKHGPLNRSVSLHGPAYDGETTWEEVLPAWFADPAEWLVCAERVRELARHVDATLSEFEMQVLALHLKGHGYQEIAQVLARPAKSVDNALQRVRRKLTAHLAMAA